MAEYWRGFLSNWQDVRTVADSFHDLDDGRVLVFLHWSGRGKTSGVDVERIQTEVATVFHLTNGKVTRLVLYFDRARALADLGLEKEAMSEEPTTPDLANRWRECADAHA